MIENGKIVKIHYTLTVDGQVVDSSSGKSPLEYEQGGGQIIPGLERELLGLKPGDHKQVAVLPENGYGPVNREAIIEIPRANLPVGELRVGMVLSGQSEDGHPLHGIVKEFDDCCAQVDFNHPLAGKLLYFDVEIIEVI
jgi:FKBP-type peptidyl-prolyl cis-trans isomerase SlyD